MKNSIYEIVKEYVMKVEGLSFHIKGRISKEINEDNSRYVWEISHYCKQVPEAATVYIPSKQSAPDFQYTEELLLQYMKAFAPIDVQENKYF